MKKTILLLIAIVFMLTSFCPPVLAAGTGALALSGAQGKQGDTVTVTVNLNANPGLATLRFSISWEEGLELTGVSNAGLLDGWTKPSPTISSPYILRWATSLEETNNTGTGTIAVLSFKISDSSTVGNKQVSLHFLESYDANGGKVSFGNTSCNVNVTCKTHNFGAFSIDAANHSHTCTVCGKTETAAHSWDGGTVTKQATCKEDGSRKFTCTVCGTEKTETVSKNTAHSYGKYTVVKQPTCTESGLQTAKCTVCGAETQKTISALGHKFGNWETSVEATCTATGEQTRVCSACKKEEKRTTKKLAHDFESPKVVREATIYSTGLMSGKCKNCGETTDQIIPCSYADEQTGVSFSAEEGAFSEGTKLVVALQEKNSIYFRNAKDSLAGISKTFTVYEIKALLNDMVVQPNGKVTVTFPVPEGYGENVGVYYLGEDGETQKVETALLENGTKIEAELEHFSLYAVCKLEAGEITPEPEKEKEAETEVPEENKNTSLVIFIILASVLVVGGAIAVARFVRRSA